MLTPSAFKMPFPGSVNVVGFDAPLATTIPEPFRMFDVSAWVISELMIFCRTEFKIGPVMAPTPFVLMNVLTSLESWARVKIVCAHAAGAANSAAAKAMRRIIVRISITPRRGEVLRLTGAYAGAVKGLGAARAVFERLEILQADGSIAADARALQRDRNAAGGYA